jgi:hypothetical protein
MPPPPVGEDPAEDGVVHERREQVGDDRRAVAGSSDLGCSCHARIIPGILAG